MSTDRIPNDGLTLDALCDQAGVTVRTVRYYIGEGLLPPPEGHGATTRYTQEHLDRLEVIGSLKSRFLPLREIRRVLDGMDQQTVAETAAMARKTAEPAAPEMPMAAAFAPSPASTDDPASYIATLLHRDQPAASVPDRPRRQDATWKRIPIADEAELLIEEGAYSRKREQIESLVAWAQRILKNS